MKYKIEKLIDNSHYNAGNFDKASRWYPEIEFEVKSAFNVRAPSRSWPYNYLKHFYTKKYANLLFFQKPLLYFKLQKIKKNTAEWRSLFAMYSAKRMEGK